MQPDRTSTPRWRLRQLVSWQPSRDGFTNSHRLLKSRLQFLPPSYQEVSRAIAKCRSSSSACPYDQISIIILKKCPIIRTIVHRIIVQCWSTRQIPLVWKRGATVLIYKRGDPSIPDNFRPITLQPVLYKMFSTVYSQRLNKFLTENHYLQKNIQKGFEKGIDGVTEHTEMLSHIIHTAKRENRSICISLLDLKNAFGLVQHTLIKQALLFHHVPEEFIQIFEDIYKNSSISVALGGTWTRNISVERGVLQGDPSSPLLFNICMNTFLLTLNRPEFAQLGFSWGKQNNRRSRSWLQYADDAIVISPDVKAAQQLLSMFESWCLHTGMIVNKDKMPNIRYAET